MLHSAFRGGAVLAIRGGTGMWAEEKGEPGGEGGARGEGGTLHPSGG